MCVSDRLLGDARLVLQACGRSQIPAVASVSSVA